MIAVIPLTHLPEYEASYSDCSDPLNSFACMSMRLAAVIAVIPLTHLPEYEASYSDCSDPHNSFGWV